MANKRCPKCHRSIIGTAYEWNHKLYCYDCYNQLTKPIIELSNIIKNRFSCSEIPIELQDFLQREIQSNNKTLYGIKKTIWYYFDILGKECALDKLIFIINDYYISAKKYLENIKHIQELNKNININIPPINIQIKKEFKAKKRNIKYKIEEL